LLVRTQGQEVNDDPRALWQQKLDFDLAEEARVADPAQRFQLQRAIDEVRTKLAELAPRLEPAAPPHPPRPPLPAAHRTPPWPRLGAATARPGPGLGSSHVDHRADRLCALTGCARSRAGALLRHTVLAALPPGGARGRVGSTRGDVPSAMDRAGVGAVERAPGPNVQRGDCHGAKVTGRDNS
jgi:hypothetical protein